jgi:hypothetical protein
MKALEYFSVPTGISGSNHSIDHLYYIPAMIPEELEDELIPLLTWYAARDICLVLKDKAGAEACTAKINEIETSQSF